MKLNVRYGTDNRQKMDVYLPTNRSMTTTLVILLHGGARIEGDNAYIKFIQDSLLKQGIATESKNYRFASAMNHYVGMMEDVGIEYS